MFKSILLCMDGSEYSRVAMRYALILAKHYEASIRALHVIDVKKLYGPLLHDVSVSLGVTPPPNFQEVFLETSRQVGDTILEEVEKACAESGISCTKVLQTGIVSQTICKEAHAVDLVVLGERGEHSEWGSRIFGSTFEATIREINKPTFVVPKARPAIRNVMVAYDGSHEANSVLKVVAEACSSEDLPVHVFTVCDDADRGEELLAEVRAYLEPYKLQSKTERLTGVAGEALIEAAERIDADVLAMGAYGRSRLHELIMGSTTEYVIRRASCPVLVYR